MTKQEFIKELIRLQERDCTADNTAILAYANAIHLAGQLDEPQPHTLKKQAAKALKSMANKF